jgi:hypothetical protein
VITMCQKIIAVTLGLFTIAVSPMLAGQDETRPSSYSAAAYATYAKMVAAAQGLLQRSISTKNIIIAATLAGATGLTLGVNPIRQSVTKYLCLCGSYVLFQLSNYIPNPRLVLLGIRLAMQNKKDYEGYKPCVEHNDINCPDGHGMAPLHVAAYHGHTAIARLLVAAGADKDAGLPGTQYAPLHLAVCMDRPEIVQALVDAGAEKEKKDYLGKTPLMLAIVCGHSEVALTLLKAGADGFATDTQGNTVFNCLKDSQKIKDKDKDEIRELIRGNKG